jgi:hypothetical protein
MADPNERAYQRIADALNYRRGYRDDGTVRLVLGALNEVVADTGRFVEPYTTTDVKGFIASWVAVFIAENPQHEDGLGEFAGIIANNLFLGEDPLMYGRPEGYFPADPDELAYATTPAEQALIGFSWDVERQLAAFPNAPTRSYQLGEIINALRINGKISAADAAALMDEDPATDAALASAARNWESLLDGAPQIMSGLALNQKATADLGELFSAELGRLGEGPVADLIPGWVEPERLAAEEREAVEETLAALDPMDLADPASIVKGALPNPNTLNAEEKVAYNAFVEEQTEAATERIRALLTGATRLGTLTTEQAEERMGPWAARAAHSFAGVLEDVAAQTQQDEALEAAQKDQDEDFIDDRDLRGAISTLLGQYGIKAADLPPEGEGSLDWLKARAEGMGKAELFAHLNLPENAGTIKGWLADYQFSQRDPEAVGKERLKDFLWSQQITADLSQPLNDRLVRRFADMTQEEHASFQAAGYPDLRDDVLGAVRQQGIEDFLGTGAALTPASAVEAAYAPGLYESLQPGAADELQGRLGAVMRGQGITDPAAAMEIVRGEVGINAFGALAPWPTQYGPEAQGATEFLGPGIEYGRQNLGPQVRTPEEMQAEYEQRMDPTQIPTPPGWALPGGGLGPPGGGFGPPGGGLPSIGPQYPEMDPYFRPELGGLQFPEDEMMAALYEAAGDNPTYLRYLMEQMPDFWKSYTDLPRPGRGVDAETYGSMVAGTSPTASVGSLEELRAMLAAEEAALEGTTRTPGAFDPTLEGYPQRKAQLEAQTRIRNLRDQIARLESVSNLPYKTGSSLFDLYPDVPESEVLGAAREASMREITRPSAAEYFAGEESRYRSSFDMSPAGLEHQLRQEREAEQERDIATREQEVERRSLLRQGPTVYTR